MEIALGLTASRASTSAASVSRLRLVARARTGESWSVHLVSAPVALVRIIIRRQLFQRHKDDEHDANSHPHRCGGYPEDQILRHSLLPARCGGT
jgi:hypothetical protein